MIYVQTIIEIGEESMAQMVDGILNDLDYSLNEQNLPTTKEIEAAVLKQALKTLLEEEEEELDN